MYIQSLQYIKQRLIFLNKMCILSGRFYSVEPLVDIFAAKDYNY